MRKAAANAKWSALEPKQRAKLAEWLFEEKLSYDEALKRAREELGYTGSRTGLQRFVRRMKQAQWIERLAESGKGADEVAQAATNTGTFVGSGMKILGHQFWERVMERPDSLDDVPTMVKLLLQNETNQIQREENTIRREAVELRRRALDFSQRRWEFDLADEVMKKFPQFQELYEMKLDANDPYAENKRVNEIRRRLYGRRDIPNPWPENAEEEAQMEEQKARESAAREQEEEEQRAARQTAQGPAVTANNPGNDRGQKEEKATPRVAKPQIPASEPPWEDEPEGDSFPFNDPEQVQALGLRGGAPSP